MKDAQTERIAAAIRAARITKNMTQEELAAKVKRTPESLSNIERAVSVPTLETVIAIADALGCSIAELVESDAAGAKPRSHLRLEMEVVSQVRVLSFDMLKVAKKQIEALSALK